MPNGPNVGAGIKNTNSLCHYFVGCQHQYHHKHCCFADTGKTARCYVIHMKQLFQNIIPASEGIFTPSALYHIA
jgi:hypothetical protein